jgi:hypothetical protein
MKKQPMTIPTIAPIDSLFSSASPRSGCNTTQINSSIYTTTKRI